jgi:hypothetical protein
MRYTPLFSLQGHRSDNDPRTRLQRINGAPHGPRFLHGYSLECAVTGGGFPPRRTARRSFPGGGGSGWRRCRTCQGVAKCSPGSSVIFGRPHPESFPPRRLQPANPSVSGVLGVVKVLWCSARGGWASGWVITQPACTTPPLVGWDQELRERRRAVQITSRHRLVVMVTGS